MATLLTALVFAAAALLAGGTIVASWRRYRGAALTHLAALRSLEPTRDFHVRIIAFGGPSTLPAHPGVRRLPHRAAPRRVLTRAAGLRAAA